MVWLRYITLYQAAYVNSKVSLQYMEVFSLDGFFSLKGNPTVDGNLKSGDHHRLGVENPKIMG